ncbi:class I SAM-dependent methyltransferase [Hymenobacter pini]|uniref:class I SAM-dependent methyltransferase n=1 Tax=Hymenobacter pini TaxID=2880879 RepID=UPI001CF40F20|nr:class I SAM-dependent methyltransferase [Hymenobacter pini]MCA8829729.1 class I SAM-dependent methyltransferase [Hymenobacter pini]
MNPTQISVATFDKLAEQYQRRYMDVSAYGPMLDVFCSALPLTEGAVLDIGCGPGNVMRYVAEKRPKLQLTGLDLAPNMLALPQANNPEATFVQMDCRDVAQLPGRFAGVLCSFCLPYLTPPEAATLIGDVAQLLVPGGAFYLSTMESSDAAAGWQTSSAGDRVYIQYHSAHFLLNTLEARKFRLLQLQRQPFQKSDGQTDHELLLVAQKPL